MSKKRTKKPYKKSNTFHIRQLHARGPNQVAFMEALEEYDVTFAIGPAGTGKTLLAVAYGLHLLNEEEVKRIVITRPVREVGENLGFLPGDLQDKMDPYMRPIFDFLTKFMSETSVQLLFDQHKIEIAPLAFMRGRTFDDSYVILDEAQNTTCEQMKMFLTRIGMKSYAVITGDLQQSDVRQKNGLADAVERLEKLSSVAVVRFDTDDIVRSRVVADIVRAYEESDDTRVPNEAEEYPEEGDNP